MAHVSDIRIGGVTLSSRVATLRMDLMTRFDNYRMYRNTLNELRSLSKRELNDLGFNEYNIEQVAYDTVYK